MKFNRVRLVIICEAITLLICALEISIGNYYLYVQDNLTNASLVQNGFYQQNIQNEAVIYIFSGCFTMLVSLSSLYSLNSTSKSIYQLTAKLYLAFFSFCMQAAIATISALSAAGFSSLMQQIYQNMHPGLASQDLLMIYQMENFYIAQSVLSFVVACPIIVGLIRLRWADWAVEAKSGLMMEYSLQSKPSTV